MKKIIVIMLVAVSALMAKGECAYSDMSFLEWILDYVEPNDVTLVCRSDNGTRYEVAVNYKLTYMVIGERSEYGGYDVTWIDRDIVTIHWYDDLGVIVKCEMKVSSPEVLMSNYRNFREHFNFQTKHNNRR